MSPASESLKTSLLLLGRFGLRLASGERISVSSRKGGALFAYVAMQPEYMASREQLAALLWGDRSDELARQSLRQCLVSLRRELPPAVADLLVLEAGRVGLNTQDLVVDAREFAALADSNEPRALARACDLYLGPFLSGIGVESEAFDEWVGAERARLESIAERVLTSCARHADAAGHGPRAIGAIQRLVAIDPFREDWQRLALRIYARHQGRGAALALADRLVARLKAELDVDVEPATKSLIADIRNGVVTPAPATIMVEAAAIDPVRDTDRTQDVAPSSMPPARQPRHLMAAMATAAALVLFVVGAWIAQRSSILQPQVLPMKSSSARAATDRSWNSPILSPSPAIDSSALATRGITTIMVWPFTSFSGRDDADRHLADAMTDDLIASLSHFPTLRVISRMTAFSYRDRDADAASTGSDLGIRYVVEGSVRSIGNVLRVNVELIDTASRLQIWGDHFERDEAHRSAVQDEIVARLARELEVGVASALSRGSGHGRAGEPVVAELIAKGQMAQYRGPQAENLNEARAYFQGALARDPELVPALVGVAVPDIMGSINYIYDAGPTLKRAATFLGRARELEPDSALVNYWTGLIQKARGASAAALRSLQRTLELNPSFTPAYAQTASVLTILGRTSEAMGPVTYAMRLSPNDPSMNIWALIAGRAEIENGHDAAALEWFRRSVELAPNNPNTHMCLASTYALLGDDENAVRELAEFKRLSASAASQHSRDDRLASEGRTNLRLFQGLRIALALRS